MNERASPYPSGYPDDPSEEEMAALPPFSLEEQLDLPEMLDRDFEHVVYTEVRKGNTVVILRTPMGITPTAAQYQQINEALQAQLRKNLPGVLDANVQRHLEARLTPAVEGLLETLQAYAEKCIATEVAFRLRNARVQQVCNVLAGMVAAGFLVYSFLK